MKAALAAVLLLAACYRPLDTAYRPVERRAETRTRGELFRASERVILSHGYKIRERDEAQGIVVSEWQEAQLSTAMFRRAWRVAVRDGGFTVFIDCEEHQQMVNGAWRWVACGDEKRPEAWLREVPSFASEISLEAASSPDGAIGGACYRNQTCDAGLTCTQGRCTP